LTFATLPAHQTSNHRQTTALGAGIRYTWLVELGNPQKVDPAMAILREQLKFRDNIWPVQRGLALLNELVRVESNRCCLLCACAEFESCHRKVVAEAFCERYFEGKLTIEDLSR
jgi:uncharacterized protein (DUF488 family)